MSVSGSTVHTGNTWRKRESVEGNLRTVSGTAVQMLGEILDIKQSVLRYAVLLVTSASSHKITLKGIIVSSSTGSGLY